AADISENLSYLPEKKISQENCPINKEDEFRENFTQESILPTHKIADKVITPDAADISENLSYLPEKKISQENCPINKEDEFRENFTQESILPTHKIADKVITPDAADISENIARIENLPNFPDISTNNSQQNSPINNLFRDDESIENFTEESILPIHQIPDKVIASDAADISENTTRSQNLQNLPDISTNNHENIPPIFEDLPAPIGLATGGLVATSNTIDSPLTAPSDTVPAMLTPGEFVINARDAQKNINFLRHINSGGALPEEVISQPTQESEATSETLSTKADTFKSSSVQRKTSNSLVSPLLGTEIENHSLSKQNSLQFNNFEDSTNASSKNSNNYSSPPMIFRQSTNTTNNKPPSQWSTVEELLSGGTDEFSMFNFEESNKQNSESPKILAKRLSSLQGFADGGEVVASDIATDIEPITETIERPSQLEEKEEGEESADLETLAMEIYGRLRQRLEIERERHGIYLGRLPW
ncbi:MAG: hypothetical protein KME60_28775, partial [Cyanomargarita calcarea GSE-NOS-MK-12-04C]|nr:hypothetical protein [Cyanomargarita calcarea GSE-NOS-MK-12-04C]